MKDQGNWLGAHFHPSSFPAPSPQPQSPVYTTAMKTSKQVEGFCKEARRHGGAGRRGDLAAAGGHGRVGPAAVPVRLFGIRPVLHLSAPLAHAGDAPARCSTSIERRSCCTASATDALRKIARELEWTIFLAGYYKAFAFLCGPCWLCKTCPAIGAKRGRAAECRHTDLARPAMEAAGIDVFATARAAGLPIEVVRTEECPQNYYALVLVE